MTLNIFENTIDNLIAQKAKKNHNKLDNIIKRLAVAFIAF